MKLRPLDSELVDKGFRRPPELAEGRGGHEENERPGSRPDYITLMCFEANSGASANWGPSGFNGPNEAPGYNKALVTSSAFSMTSDVEKIFLA